MIYSDGFAKSCSTQFEAGLVDELKDLKTEVPVVETITDDAGRVQKKLVMKELDSDRFEGVSVYDYSLENILAVGAVGALKEVNINGSGFGSIDSLVSTLDALDSVEVSEE